MIDYISHFENYCRETGLDVRLSFDMPAGYETAFGTFDVVQNTVFLNESILQNMPEFESLFYLYHELRHAQQYLKPELFSKELQKSRFYVILYNGVCYKLVGSRWKECTLEGAGEYFTHAYLSLPYELDANTFAHKKVASILGNSPQLQELASFCLPPQPLSYEELQKIFDRIDNVLVAPEQGELC